MDDLKLQIATGKSVRSKLWKNETYLWGGFVARLEAVIRTPETAAEYNAADKPTRAAAKDVGGFVGGYLNKGRRKPDAVLFRSVVTLDIDDAKGQDVPKAVFSALSDFEYVLHSTHSHTEDDPRYRLIMPLDREAMPAEYVAVARRLGEYVGIELFDETGYQPFRLMYWPSCSSDAEYVFLHNEGKAVPADELLGTYVDWQDASSWPTSKDFADKLRTGLDRQKDPLDKPGAIGVFCRSYDIHEAIAEFLPTVYEQSETDENRYTYTLGGTANGMIVYDDATFAFSHHGTDPASYQLVNAYDLVRIHKFGDLDNEQGIKRSMDAMNTLVYDDDKVKTLASQEQIEKVRGMFDGLAPETKKRNLPGDAPAEDDEVEDFDWMADLTRSKSGDVLSSAANLRIIFANDPMLSSTIKRNEFDTYSYVFPGIPWREVAEPDRWRNVDFSGLRAYIEIVYGISSAGKIDDALAIAQERNTYHPVKDYLQDCSDVWDGEERVPTLLVDYQGAEDNAYTRAAMVTWMAAAVARIYEPGKKFDLVLTLQGGQGTGKSTFFSALGGGYYSDTFGTFDGVRAFEQLQGAWIIEMAELAGMSKSAIDTVKGFISKRVDQYRPAYGRTVEKYPRQCVFAATTNEDEFLRDATGNRRFVPVVVDPEKAEFDAFDLEADPDYIAQLWGEAVHYYFSGVKLYMTGEAAKLHTDAQRRHQVVDNRVGMIRDYLDLMVPPRWPTMEVIDRKFYYDEYDEDALPEDAYMRDRVTAIEVWAECLREPREKFTQAQSRAVNTLIQSLPEWKPSGRYARFKPYGKQRYYVRFEN